MEHVYLRAPFNVAVCDLANKMQAAEAVVAHVLARDVLAWLSGLAATDSQIAGLNRAPEQTVDFLVALSQPFSSETKSAFVAPRVPVFGAMANFFL